MRKEKDIWKVIASFIDGASSKEDGRFLTDWINENTENTKTFEILTNIHYRYEPSGTYANRKKIFTDIQQRISRAKQIKTIRFWQYMAAASVSLFIAVSVWMVTNLTENRPVAQVTTHTSKGIKTDVTLPDGSLVSLNAGSVLTYPVRFKGRCREVLLSGEGYFKVSKDERHPFIVKTTDLDISVLGTRFNIRAYENEKQFFATLIEGSVRIMKKSKANHNSSGLVVMKPGQQFVFDKSSGKMSLRRVNAWLYGSWKDGQFYFDRKPFEFIAGELERAYNIGIVILSDTLKKEIFSGIFDRKDNISHILFLMKRHHDFNFSDKGDTIIIYKDE